MSRSVPVRSRCAKPYAGPTKIPLAAKAGRGMVFSAVLVVALLPLLCCPLLHLLAHGARRGVGHALCAILLHVVHPLEDVGHVDTDLQLGVLLVPIAQTVTHALQGALVLVEHRTRPLLPDLVGGLRVEAARALLELRALLGLGHAARLEADHLP